MRIAAAQIHPLRGDIQGNLTKHIELIKLALPLEADLILFPELSLTGYEPSLAKKLAVAKTDELGERIAKVCGQHQLSVAIGLPICTGSQPGNGSLPNITCLVISSGGDQTPIPKRFLHEDELPFFSSPISSVAPIWKHVGIAICYEISVSQHAKECVACGAEVYAASVAKTINDIDKAHHRLQEVAQEFSIPCIMANSIGDSEEGICGGRSAAWNKQGMKLAELDANREGVLLFDTDTEEVAAKNL